MPDSHFKNQFRLADAIRALNAEIVASDAPDDVFSEAIEKIKRFSQELSGKPQRSRKVGPRKDAEGKIVGFEYGPDMKYFSPVSGQANPLSPPMRMCREGDTAIGFVNFPAACEGPPTLVHGGFIAAVFDELFGLTISFIEKPCMTGALTIRYKSPCPLKTDLQLKGHVDAVRGRGIITKGTMHAGDQVVAEAEAIFIAVDHKMYEGFAETRDNNS